MRITAEQYQALEADAKARLVACLVNVVRTYFVNAEEPMPPRLDERVSGHLLAARAYGLSSEQHVASYVLAAEILGPSLTSHERVRDWLLSRRSPADKAGYLDALLIATSRAADGLSLRGSS